MSNFSLDVKVGGDATGFRNEMKKLDGIAQNAIGGLKSIVAGAFTIGAITEFTHSIIEMGGQVQDMSTRMGVSVEEVQSLDFAAKQTGNSVEDLADAYKKLKLAINEAQKAPHGDKADAFARMGVSIEDLASKSPSEIFKQIAESSNGAAEGGQKFADIISILGKNSDKLIPTLAELSDKMREAKRSGLILSKDDIAQLDDAGDKLDKLGTYAKVAGANFFNLVTSGEKITDALAGLFIDYGADMKGAIAESTIEQLKKLKAASDAAKAASAPPPDVENASLTQKIADAKTKLAKAAFDLLSPEQKRIELLKQQSELEQKIADAQEIGTGGRKLGEQEKALLITNLQTQLAELQGKLAGVSGTRSAKAYTDSALTVGNFLGQGRASGLESIAQNHFRESQKQTALLAKIEASKGATINVP